jgi:hypothetical protein
LVKTSTFLNGGLNTALRNVERYWPITGSLTPAGGEPTVQTKVYTSLTLKNLYVRVTANTVLYARTVITRKDGVNGNLTISIPASTSGVFEDTVNSDSLVSGNLICYYLSAPGGASGTTTITVVSTTAEHADAQTSYLVAGGCPTLAASTTYYFSPNGGFFGLLPTIEENVDHVARFAATLSKFRVYIYTNTLTGASTARTRKNNANGGQSVSIPAGTTGAFEDASGTDSVAAGNSINYQLVTGGGTSLVLSTLAVQIQPSNPSDSFPLWLAYWETTFAYGVTRYYTIAGEPFAHTTEANAQAKLRQAVTLSKLFVGINSNTINNSTTIRSRVATDNGTLSVSIPASTTGEFEDTSNSDAVSSTALVNYQIDVGGTSGAICVALVGTSTGTLIVVPTVTTQAASGLGLD